MHSHGSGGLRGLLSTNLIDGDGGRLVGSRAANSLALFMIGHQLDETRPSRNQTVCRIFIEVQGRMTLPSTDSFPRKNMPK